ncbi:cytochrome P450 monooxygenase ATR2 [Trichoderma asperellum]|uniref:Cytochrome P450 monooxygenase ATR2 n=1 Tax=Trichoderma asperellum TaxID=101201 RepID=A0A6V8R425_TRIAP|nr:cytochrome P450 [Trichoderma asperelloides]GFP59787.1 cytochrome P450 monooxygenase ATR2 [Trichoderma asperellum]
MDPQSNSTSFPWAAESSALSAYWTPRTGYYLTIFTVLLSVWLFLRSNPESSKLCVPLYKTSKLKWIFDAESQIVKSYKQFQDQVYQIKATEGIQAIIPPKFIAEIKGLPEDILSATEAVADALQTKYTKFSPGHNGEMLSLLVRTRLTQNLAELIPQLKSELEHYIGTEFPACDDWTPVKWQPFALRGIARLSGRAFVGPWLNREEQWLKVTIDFAIDVFMSVIKLQFFPEWFRPIAQYAVSDLRKIRKDIDIAKSLLKPLLEERIRDMEISACHEPPNDLMQWLIEALPEEEKADVDTHALLQLILAAASIHTTNNLLFECMADLADHPEIQQELREEAYQILEAENGWARKESMTKLKKLDSFMREVQRLRGNVTSFIRKVIKPIDLSDGTHLPAGTRVLAPQAGISIDEQFFHNPTELDPLRFYHMRQESAEASNRWQFTSLNDTNLNFGAGKHACPGRFFAGNEIKLILAFFLINYDVRLKKGDKRPQPMALVMTKGPNPNTEFEFRRRQLAN